MPVPLIVDVFTADPLMVYETVAPGVPLSVKVPVLPEHTGPLLDVTEAVGNALMVTVPEADAPSELPVMKPYLLKQY